ncbi:MAG: substrate-binding domain-containing protein [Pirellulaceae bacterium]
MLRQIVRRGRLNTLSALFLGSVVLAVVLVVALMYSRPRVTDSSSPLILYCAAGMRVPVEQIVEAYEREYGVRVEIHFGGSGALLSQLEVDKFSEADLYVAADTQYTDLAREKGLAVEVLPAGHVRPVIAVRRDCKKTIESLQDLLRDDVGVVLGNSEGPAIGRITKERLERVPAGDETFWSRLEAHVRKNGVFKPTVNDVAQDVKLGAMDAGIVWDSTVAMPGFREQLRAISVEELAGDPSLVSVCVLTSSPRPTSALRFARYLTARDRGLPSFEEYGIRPVEGDVWEERPQLTFFCGAVNRRAIEQVLDRFQEREGVEINTIYDGCGILTSRMKTFTDQSTDLGFPDVYMACDVYYLENVKEWFQEAANVSDTEIVIAVPKGSSKVTGLKDLIRPGIRVAIGEPDQCTIGALTRRLLQREGLYESLKKKQQQPGEVVVEKSSSAHLVPDVTTSNVDAAVAYITDVLANQNKVDIVRIESDLNKAIQPFSIARSSDFKYLSRRLFQRIAQSPEAFEDAGFHFRLGEDDPSPPTEATRDAVPEGGS